MTPIEHSYQRIEMQKATCKVAEGVLQNIVSDFELCSWSYPFMRVSVINQTGLDIANYVLEKVQIYHADLQFKLQQMRDEET